MIYLDFNASTPPDSRVVEAMLPHLKGLHANAASTDHAAGAQAAEAVEHARSSVSRLIGATDEEIIFTSGATEANNIAISGQLRRAEPGEVLVSAVEHPAVVEPASAYGRVRLLPVDEQGFVDPETLRGMLTRDTRLVCVMAANNETGAVQDLSSISRICAEAEVPLHVDAAQAAGRLKLDVSNLSIATLAISGHKMYGPQGVGALYVRRSRPRPRVAPILFGGGHERNLRPGTINTPGVVGLGVAAQLAHQELAADAERHGELRKRFISRLAAASPVPLRENCTREPRLPQTISLRFEGIRSAAVLRLVSRDLAVSTGAACSTTKVEPSHVLLAQGLSRDEVSETIRLSFGRQTTEHELDDAVGILAKAVSSVAELTSTHTPDLATTPAP